MITQAHNIRDAKHVITLLQQFLLETSYDQAEEAARDVEHLGRLTFSFMQNGYIWLAIENQQAMGMLIAIKETNLWNRKHNQLREMIWYVKPEYRKSLIPGRLFLAYCKKAEELKSQGQISGYFTTRMATTDSFDLESRGFKLKEQIYLKE